MQRQSAIKMLKALVYVGIYGGLLMPLMFVPVVIFPFVFSKLIFFQVLIGLTFPAYIILAWIEPEFRPKKSMLYLAICAYFLALLLSVIFAVDPVRAWWGNQERMNGFFTLLHFFIWLTMTVSVIKTWTQWNKLLNYQVILGVFMAIVALLQKPYPALLLFPAASRVGGLLDNPIYMGAYQIFILFFLALLWVKNKSVAWRAWYVVAFIFSMGAMFAAGSRGPFMGLIFGIAVSAITVGVLVGSKKIKIILFSVIFAGVLCYVGIVTVGIKTQAFQSFSKEFPTASRMFSLQTGTTGRFIAWNIAWEGFIARPLTGWGLDDFHILFNKYYNPKSLESGYYETWFDRAHNTVFDVISMTGIVGFLTFAAVWVLLYASIIRARKKRFIDITTTAILMGLPAGYFLQNLFVFDHPAAFSMSFLLYAFVICIGFPIFSGQPDPNAVQKVPSQKPVPWITFGILQVIFILIAYFTSVLPAYASYLSIKSNNAFASGDAESWLAYAKEAAVIQTPYLDEQTFLHSRNMINMIDGGALQQWPKWKEMFALIQDVSKRHLASHGMNTHPLFIYASLLQSVGQATNNTALYQEAETYFKRAIETSPKRQQLYFAYGRLLIQMGRAQEGLDKYKEAASFDESIGEGWWYVGVSTWFDLGNQKEGAKYIIKSMSAAHPFSLRGGQDAVLVAQAYDMENDKEGLKKLFDMLPNLAAAPAASYIEIAKSMEHQGLMEQRDMILGAVIKMDPTSQPKFQALIDGRAKTIDESIKLATTTTPGTSQLPTGINVVQTQASPVTTVQEPTQGGPRR
ncbi:MAG: O-antigen ligase family protein [Patescibacteria group bacterium]